VIERRKKQAAFYNNAAERVRRELSRCAEWRVSKEDFWRAFWREWKKWRFQKGAFQIKGKNANWPQACAALCRILDAPEAKLDSFVRQEIDVLAKKPKNPVRRAWLTEMLCHYRPELYPVDNDPVRKWLSRNKYPARRGISEGRYYVELAQRLREIVRESHPSGARNLAELDAAIRRLRLD
jgi:hypothetical protein